MRECCRRVCTAHIFLFFCYTGHPLARPRHHFAPSSSPTATRRPSTFASATPSPLEHAKAGQGRQKGSRCGRTGRRRCTARLPPLHFSARRVARHHRPLRGRRQVFRWLQAVAGDGVAGRGWAGESEKKKQGRRRCPPPPSVSRHPTSPSACSSFSLLPLSLSFFRVPASRESRPTSASPAARTPLASARRKRRGRPTTGRPGWPVTGACWQN